MSVIFDYVRVQVFLVPSGSILRVVTKYRLHIVIFSNHFTTIVIHFNSGPMQNSSTQKSPIIKVFLSIEYISQDHHRVPKLVFKRQFNTKKHKERMEVTHTQTQKSSRDISTL